MEHIDEQIRNSEVMALGHAAKTILDYFSRHHINGTTKSNEKEVVKQKSIFDPVEEKWIKRGEAAAILGIHETRMDRVREKGLVKFRRETTGKKHYLYSYQELKDRRDELRNKILMNNFV